MGRLSGVMNYNPTSAYDTDTVTKQRVRPFSAFFEKGPATAIASVLNTVPYVQRSIRADRVDPLT